MGWGLRALSVLKVVSLITGNARSVVVEGGALVGDGDADSVAVEDPIVGALKADLFVPVPRSAADV